MVIGILTRLAGFSLKRPKLVMSLIVGFVAVSIFAHYRIVVGKNEELKRERVAYRKQPSPHSKRARRTLQEDIAHRATRPPRPAVAERDEARRTVEAFREGRTDQAVY